MTDDAGTANTAKTHVRSQIRGVIRTLPRTEVERRSSMICRRLTVLPVWQTCREVLVYRSMPGEVDTTEVIASALREGKRAFLPRIDGESLIFHQYTGGKLIRHRYGMMEPPGEAPRWDRHPSPHEPVDDVHSNDVVLVCPGIAFDASGRRLGRGRGFYDRFIATVRTKPPNHQRNRNRSLVTVIGIGFDLQIVDTVPTESGDERMDIVVTESRTIVASR